jgi:hypothetical protein
MFEGDSQRTKIVVFTVLVVAGVAGLAPGNLLVNNPATSPIGVGLVYGLGVVWVGICVWLGVSIGLELASRPRKMAPGELVCEAENHERWCNKTYRIFNVDSGGHTVEGDEVHRFCKPTWRIFPIDGEPRPLD